MNNLTFTETRIIHCHDHTTNTASSLLFNKRICLIIQIILNFHYILRISSTGGVLLIKIYLNFESTTI
ncbi:unnamed protein product [Schistosoma guineensis]|nr:unnamed protein product [Schistosoma guineensis]